MTVMIVLVFDIDRNINILAIFLTSISVFNSSLTYIAQLGIKYFEVIYNNVICDKLLMYIFNKKSN